MGGHLSPHTPSDPVARSKGGSIQRPVGERDGARVHAALRTEGPSTAGLRQAMGDTPLKHFWHTARTGGPAGGAARSTDGTEVRPFGPYRFARDPFLRGGRVRLACERA